MGRITEQAQRVGRVIDFRLAAAIGGLFLAVQGMHEMNESNRREG